MRSFAEPSTKRMIEELDVELAKIAYADIAISLAFSDELRAALEKITDTRIFQRIKRTRISKFEYQYRGLDCSFYFRSSYRESNSIQIQQLIEMMQIFDSNQCLISQLPEEQQAAIEEYRCVIMRAVYKDIDKLGRKPARVREIKKDVFERMYDWAIAHWAGVLAVMFGTLFIVGMALDMLYNYAGFFEILSLVPFIPAPLAIGLCVTFSLLNLILYIAFEGAMLGEMFDIRPSANELKKLTCWDEQHQLARNINERLRDPTVQGNMEDPVKQNTYELFNKQCDRMVLRRQLSFADEDCNESPKRTRIRIALICVGALLSIGSSFFSAVSMLPVIPTILPFLAAAMLTPYGPPIFVAVVVISMLVGYFAMQRKGIGQLISPNLDKKQEIARELNDYHDREPSQITVKRGKQPFEKFEMDPERQARIQKAPNDHESVLEGESSAKLYLNKV